MGEGLGRDCGCKLCSCGAEGEVRINSQAKGLSLDDTLESRNAPKKLNLSGNETERAGNDLLWRAF